MQRVLIVSRDDDAHCSDVWSALTLSGHSCDIWKPSAFPLLSAESISFDESGTSIDVSAAGFTGKSLYDHYDAIWYRRIGHPEIDESNIHPDDLQYVKSSANFYHKHRIKLLQHSITTDATTWVNDPLRAEEAEGKLLQLQVARKSGFTIAPTLISNDPPAIRSFVASMAGAVCKPLVPHLWLERDPVSNYTRLIKESDLPSDEVLRLCPEIFQARVRRAAEWRIFIVGKSAFGVRLAGPDLEDDTEVDWRRRVVAKPTAGEWRPVPELLQTLCNRVMDGLGLLTGSFDIIETIDGSFVFLEVNQAGQFLFLEACGVPALEAITQFLVNPSKDFRYQMKSDPINLATINKQNRLPVEA